MLPVQLKAKQAVTGVYNGMKRFKRILYVASSQRASKVALERAVNLAEHNQASLTVAGIAPKLPSGAAQGFVPKPDHLQAAVESNLRQRLGEITAVYRDRIDIDIEVLRGVPFLEIIRDVLRNRQDLVIKVPESGDWLDRLFGSEDMHLLRKCPCPLWLIKPKAPKSYRCIVAAVDVGDEYPEAQIKTRWELNHDILRLASSIALAESAELHVVSAWEAAGESTLRGAFINTPAAKISAYVEEIRQRRQRNLDRLIDETDRYLDKSTLDSIKLRLHLMKGRPRRKIPAVARTLGADLMVMGTVARTGVPGLMIGNTAETILNQIDCSVLAIKPVGFVTPVTLEG